MLWRSAFWLSVLAGWTLLVIVFAVSSSLTYALTYQPPRWRYTMTMAATECYVWAAFTPLHQSDADPRAARHCGRRRGVFPDHRPRRALPDFL